MLWFCSKIWSNLPYPDFPLLGNTSNAIIGGENEEGAGMKVRVRFAPSPTGPLHIGGARSALFNFLFAKRYGGEFIVRIEDTDLERSSRDYEAEIIESLEWLGITWDEGIKVGGPNGPYRQTERLDIYQRWVDILVSTGWAYPCFCTEEELEEEREQLMKQGETPRYLGRCRNLDEAERQAKLAQGLRPTIRFRVPEHRVFVVEDLVRGRVAFESENMGDFIIVKSDGLPTYNFAVVIDDHLMGITHVIRAEEHLSNTPRQLMIYEALGLEPPKFAHISLILGADRQKMSKRHGATSVIQYRQQGYLPEALVNFLALLGWAPEGEEEIMSLADIANSFSLERVAKNPAVFDVDKLNWINQQYIKRKSTEELKELLWPFIERAGYRDEVKSLGDEKYTLLVETMRDYLVCLSDITDKLDLVFKDAEPDHEAEKVLLQEGVVQVLRLCSERILDQEASPQEMDKFLKSLVKDAGVSAKKVYMPLRAALTGKVKGPELPYLMALWGTNEVRRRLERAVKRAETES